MTESEENYTWSFFLFELCINGISILIYGLRLIKTISAKKRNVILDDNYINMIQ